MGYRVVDSYYRQPLFDLFRKFQLPIYSVTVELDITGLRDFTRKHELPIYLNSCYFFARAMQEIEDFRYHLVDDRIVLYDELQLGLTLPAPGGMFSFAHIRYDPDVWGFNERAKPVLEQAKSALQMEPPDDHNYIFFTAASKLRFIGVTHPVMGPTEQEPKIAFGQHSERDGRLSVPVGMQVNHIFIDGAAMWRSWSSAYRKSTATRPLH